MAARLLVVSLLPMAIADPIRIALYGGGGAILGDKDYPYTKTIEEASTPFGESSVTVLLENGIRNNLTNDAFDVVFFPGGSGHGQATAIGSEGQAAVKAFVAAGGGYIGTCGGAFLGMSTLLFYGDGISLQGFGTGTTQVEFAKQSFQDFGLSHDTFDGNVTIFYQGGPIVALDSLPSDVSVLAWYRAKLPSSLPVGQRGLNTPAVTSSSYGKGRVVLNSPHAEHTKSLGIGPAFYHGQLAWILQREPVPMVSDVKSTYVAFV